jgi:hypothetical protein
VRQQLAADLTQHETMKSTLNRVIPLVNEATVMTLEMKEKLRR